MHAVRTKKLVLLTVFLLSCLSFCVAISATKEQKNSLLQDQKKNEHQQVHHHHLHHSAEVTATVKAVEEGRNSQVSVSLSKNKVAKLATTQKPSMSFHSAYRSRSHKRDDSLLEMSTKSLAKDTLHSQAHAHARARAKATQMGMLMSGVSLSANAPAGLAFGRGRGGYQRGGGYFGPSEFDNSWWQPPPSVGGDPFLQGYSQKVMPQHLFGYGGMPNGGFGTAHHYWGQGAYIYPMNQPWWRGRTYANSMASLSPGPSRGISPYLPYQTPRDSFGIHQPGMGASLPVSSPYYYTPPPLQGDWNLPRNPVAPPPEASSLGNKIATPATEGSS